MKCNPTNDPEHECIECDRDEPTFWGRLLIALDQPDRASTGNRAMFAGLVAALCVAALLAWPLISTLFRALMRHHYSLLGAVP